MWNTLLWNGDMSPEKLHEQLVNLLGEPSQIKLKDSIQLYQNFNLARIATSIKRIEIMVGITDGIFLGLQLV